MLLSQKIRQCKSFSGGLAITCECHPPDDDFCLGPLSQCYPHSQHTPLHERHLSAHNVDYLAANTFNSETIIHFARKRLGVIGYPMYKTKCYIPKHYRGSLNSRSQHPFCERLTKRVDWTSICSKRPTRTCVAQRRSSLNQRSSKTNLGEIR